MPENLLSIVVPTCNRLEVATKTIATLAAQQTDVEIIVQDCGDDDRLGAMLTAAGAGRVSYRHAGRNLSMAENWSEGLARATGTYVTVVGDDDGMLPEGAAAARWMAREGLEALNIQGSGLVRYRWPTVGREGYAFLYDATGTAAPLDAPAEFHRQCRGHGGTIEWLAGPYYGIVRRDILCRLRERTGCWADGLSPDHYLALTVSSVVERAMRVDYPLFLAGKCAQRPTSQETDGAVEHTRKHVAQYASLRWPEHLPQEPLTYRAATAQTLDVALRRLGRADLTRELALAEVYGEHLVVSPRSAIRELGRFTRTSRGFGRSVVAGYAGVVHQAAQYVASMARAKAKVRVRFGFPIPGVTAEIRGVEDITQAIELTREHVVRVGLRAPWRLA